MSGLRSLLGAAALLALLGSALLGCGGTVIDSAKTEEQLRASLSKSLGERVGSVDCPSDIEVEKGNTFACGVKLESGEEQRVTLRIENEDADVTVTSLRPVNE